MAANITPAINLEHMKTCVRCDIRYDWRKSSSSTLKMTYCSHLCEQGDLGFTLEAILHAERKTPIETTETAEPEITAV